MKRWRRMSPLARGVAATALVLIGLELLLVVIGRFSPFLLVLIVLLGIAHRFLHFRDAERASEETSP